MYGCTCMWLASKPEKSKDKSVKDAVGNEWVTQHPYETFLVTAQIALDLFENKENTRSVLLHSSMFDAVIGQLNNHRLKAGGLD